VAATPTLVFRDTECRDPSALHREAKRFQHLLDMLRSGTKSPGIRRVFGVAFNPMSEGAILAFPELLGHVEDSLSLKLPPDLARQKQCGEFVSKDKLEEALGVDDGARKRELDRLLADRIATHGFGDAADHATSTLARLREFLASA
jgi:hypothetical protein